LGQKRRGIAKGLLPVAKRWLWKALSYNPPHPFELYAKGPQKTRVRPNMGKQKVPSLGSRKKPRWAAAGRKEVNNAVEGTE